MGNTLHSLIDSVATAGTVYGWRLDAVLLTGALWIATCTARRLVSAIA
jgi:hypothetical protein